MKSMFGILLFLVCFLPKFSYACNTLYDTSDKNISNVNPTSHCFNIIGVLPQKTYLTLSPSTGEGGEIYA